MSAVLNQAQRRVARRQVEHAPNRRSARLSTESLTMVPAEMVLRPLRDQMIVEPLDVVHSRILIVPAAGKPVRGKVLAVGPGHYPTRYQDSHGDYLPDWNRQKRAKSAAGTRFIPTTVKVGDIVHLGGMEHGGYSFEGFYHGRVYCIHCREADVAGVENA